VTTWRGVRKEIVGAWRSVQYDLNRTRKRGGDGDDTTELIFPEHAGRPPRRLFATGGFAVVSIAGAIGTYFAVVNGLGALLEPGPAEQEAPASVVAGAAGTGGRPQDVTDVTPDRPVRIARQGGPLTVAGREAAVGGAGSWDTHDDVTGNGGPAPDLVRDPGNPVPEESDATPPEDPTDPPSPTADPTPVNPTPTADPTPSPTASPTASEQHDEGRRRHRHHRPHPDENP
jgi:hypothetical protein